MQCKLQYICILYLLNYDWYMYIFEVPKAPLYSESEPKCHKHFVRISELTNNYNINYTNTHACFHTYIFFCSKSSKILCFRRRSHYGESDGDGDGDVTFLRSHYE